MTTQEYLFASSTVQARSTTITTKTTTVPTTSEYPFVSSTATGLNEVSDQGRSQMPTLQRDLTEMTTRDYEQLNESNLQLSNPVVYQQLAKNNRQT
jgi:hypothetical protein